MRLEHEGHCPVCRRGTVFVAVDDWLRDSYLCTRCRTIPRQRALVLLLDQLRPEWRQQRLHESSPTLGYFGEACPRYSYSHYLPGVARGASRAGVRCEDLEHLTFADSSFDVFITQDVLEHVFDPGRALQEVMRCIAPGGMHIFTTPKHGTLPASRCRAVLRAGAPVHLHPPTYHGNPVGDGQSLVTWDFGADFEGLVQSWSGYLVSTHVVRDRRFGIDGEFLEVFVQVRHALNNLGPAAPAARETRR